MANNELEKCWFVIYTSGLGSRGVLQVQSLLDRLEYDGMVWVPVQKSIITKYGKSQNTDKPLFPSYVFLHTHIEDSKLEQALIENKIGRFLKYAGDEQHPAVISESDIEHLKSLEEVDVEPVPEEIITVELGNVVEVCVGPFMGIKGIVTGVHGHEVSIETLVFGRSAPIRINSSHLSKVTENSNETPKE